MLDSVKCACFMCSVWMSTLPNCEKRVMDLPLHLIKEGNVTENRHTVLFRTPSVSVTECSYIAVHSVLFSSSYKSACTGGSEIGLIR